MCTGLRLACADGAVVHGRTVEFAVDLDLDVMHVPAGTTFTSGLSAGAGASWTTAHSVVGVGRASADAVMDGINDAGLTAGAFYFPGTADYAADDGGADGVAPQDFVHWVLTTCASIAEMRDRIHEVRVLAVDAPEWGGVAPFHYVVYDPDGTSVAVEPIAKTLQITDNPFGSLTNSPELGFHLKNLSQYMQVTPHTPDTISIGATPITGFGTGTGSLGLPGDFTSPSRFVRATLFSADHSTPATAAAGIQEVFHILNQFDIPYGFITVHEAGEERVEWTLGTVAHDPGAGAFYFRSYGDQTLRRVTLADLDTAENGHITRTSMGPAIGDLTAVVDANATLAPS
ncbi:linear amide C-N hydrolase [Rhabdothermincola salaria]|uniref:linear amide C-N hydrolase n=1 Tax=Rhabdothermincola salaria TaxID=2903142 RepID=UPI001E3088A4|nr:linear amide C-N hydrolase [Rhabdothermincola salaria]MCD9622599.1 linear amide C-N hydrolase [Rhabdothermincola salaria]